MQTSASAAFFLAASLTLAAAFAFSAEEFWETKEPGDWTPAEIQQISSASPWARKVRADVPPELPKPMGELITTPSRDSMSASQRGISNGAASGARVPARRTPKAGGLAFYGEAIIRWESAAPLAAVAKMPLPAEFTGHYVITVSGLPKQMLLSLLKRGIEPFRGTNLSVKGRPEIPMEYVFLTKDQRTLGFAVPAEKLPLRIEDRAAQFTMMCEGLRLRARFNLQTMTYRRKLAL